MGSYVKLCPMRQTACKALVGRFLQFRWQISRNPASALSFRPWPFSFGWGANRQTGYAPGFAATLFLSIPHTPALTGLLARFPAPPGANRKPCKPCFLVERWRNAALSPPVWELRQEGPVLPVVVDGVTNREGITAFPDHNERPRPSPSSRPSRMASQFATSSTRVR